MIISQNQIHNVMQAYSKQKIERVQTNARKTKALNGVKYGEDKLELSREGKEFKLAFEAILKTPDIRTEKVSDLKQKIEKGTYIIDGEKVAEKIIGRIIVDELV
ncbi:MAG: flagellar biosynthesis anti-sigma factor FlgM [Firmicutes bacterium]|jgi:negative regulator of flagellin synthesis FlgM|nr:flagellar biosynthesis anti-sigma factor FlgM [Bacillota bacterium]